MEPWEIALIGVGCALLAALLSVGLTVLFFKKKKNSLLNESEKLLEQTKDKAEKLLDHAKLEAKAEKEELLRTAEKDISERKKQILQNENKLDQREAALDKREDVLIQREESLDQKKATLEQREEKVSGREKEIQERIDKAEEELQRVAGLTQEEALKEIMAKVEEKEAKRIALYREQMEEEAQSQVQDKARAMLAMAMDKYAQDVTSEHSTSTVALPSDEMKGRIIGKEGRNIQALQRATGVDILVDDTPGMVVLSSFDPIRRQVARYALERLMKDGRINPASIEEAVAKAEREIEKEVVRAGEDAAREVGVVGIPRELIHLLGELKFRTSYGQNVLLHSVEMAHIAGMIADEVGADKRVTKTATLLHDIGKAVTHKIEGKHAEIGAELAKKYGMSDAVVHAMAAHHNDIEPTTPEAVIVKIVDALSAARPGARNISAENFAERMRDLENIATSFPGIDKAYAISAGREIRVIVEPKQIDDLSALKLARDIANKIEATMSYPGVIKVNVIRETRAVEYAK